jgi:tryptophan-rich sensory protein
LAATGPTPNPSLTRRILVHAAMVAAVVGAGALIGSTFTPGAWYAALEKPWFTPPPAAFGPIWTVLYALIGWTGARLILSARPSGRLSGPGLGLWLLQMALNFSWSPTFFGMQWAAGGLAVIAALWLVILAFIVTMWHRDRVAALLFLPYITWVTLATAVNAGVVWLNP